MASDLKNIASMIQRMIGMDMLEIKKGGKYKVISNSGTDQPMITEGEYIGYTLMGEDGAVVFKMEDGMMRLIPVGNLIAIEFKPEEIETKEKKEDKKENLTYIS
ncbi:hypothetical protein [Caldiplasma sukawensis]